MENSSNEPGDTLIDLLDLIEYLDKLKLQQAKEKFNDLIQKESTYNKPEVG